MSRRFRPFYVAAFAVVMVGLYGTEVIPKSQPIDSPESVSVQPNSAVASADDGASWLGPQIKAPSDLLDLTASFSILPFDVGN